MKSIMSFTTISISKLNSKSITATKQNSKSKKKKFQSLKINQSDQKLLKGGVIANDVLQF